MDKELKIAIEKTKEAFSMAKNDIISLANKMSEISAKQVEIMDDISAIKREMEQVRIEHNMIFHMADGAVKCAKKKKPVGAAQPSQ